MHPRERGRSSASWGQYQIRPDQPWSGGTAGVTNHQIVRTLETNPALRDYTAVADRVAAETGMIKSAAGAAAYLVDQTNPRKTARLAEWHEGVIDGAGRAKSDPRLVFRKTMFAMTRKQAGVLQRRRDNRGHVVVYLKAFSAWATAESVTQLRCLPRETAPAIAKA